jgi:2-amino-4-hydroxy-6-hydroxymethyldihydropteridine diphosphokinase
LQTIENKAGRLRKDNRWGARILDLDILLFGQQLINNERLTIPHYGLKTREFVLLPLQEISPNLILPSGDSLDELIQGLDQNGLKIFDNSLQL